MELHLKNVGKKYIFHSPFSIGENPCSKNLRNSYNQIDDAFSPAVAEGQNRSILRRKNEKLATARLRLPLAILTKGARVCKANIGQAP